MQSGWIDELGETGALGTGALGVFQTYGWRTY